MSKLKIVFMGSPAYAVPTLEALLSSPLCEVCAVVTQPDKPCGRGKKLAPPPVKMCAQAHDIPCYQPQKLKTPEMYDTLCAIAPDFFVTIAYGKILRPSFLAIPKIAPLNLHASLLPNLRGAAPIQWSIIRGDHETGVTLMKMDEGMDTGPIYDTVTTPIAPDETTESLFARLARLSAQILMENIAMIASGQLSPIPQQGTPSTAPMLQKSLSAIDFHTDAIDLDRLCRGISEWPTACCLFDNKHLSLLKTHAIIAPSEAPAGTILRLDPSSKSLYIACQSNILAVDELQLEGKKRTSAESFCNGYRPIGKMLSSIPSS